MLGKLVVLQTIGALLLIAGWFTGIVPLILEADHVHAVPVLGVLLVIGLWAVGTRRMETAHWIGDKLPVISLVYTVLGLIMAVKRAQGMDIDTARLQIFTDVAYSLVANLCGMAGYFWLSLTARICSNDAK